VEREGGSSGGVVRYIVDPAGTGCEFAVALADAWHGPTGGHPHACPDRHARSRGLTTMEGFVLAANVRMLKFSRQLGFSQQRNPEDRDTVRIVRSL
jgi:acetyltransferase